jgi:hypothetical protein
LENLQYVLGKDFTVDASVGLNGVCDFLISRSPEQLEIEAPAIVLVEAKDLTDYALTPIDRLLGMLVWMVEKG